MDDKVDAGRQKPARATEANIDERIAELHAQGILVGGEGPRDALWSMPKLPPGALKRFLDEQYRGYRKPGQE